MKTIEIPENAKKVIIELQDGTTEEKTFNNYPFVPKEIGISPSGYLLFNDNKSYLKALGGLYDVNTLEYRKFDNFNTGENHTYEPTTCEELKEGDIFVVEDVICSKELFSYNLKINDYKFVYIDGEDICVSKIKGYNNYKLFKIVKV